MVDSDDAELLAKYNDAFRRAANPKRKRGKLTGEAKAAFLRRMAADRRKAGKNPKRGPRGEVDSVAARELLLWAENTSELYPQKIAIIKNLSRRVAKGQYDAEKAVKLWRYWVDRAAKHYQKEFGTGNIFNVPTRNAVARELAVSEHGAITRGEYKDNPGKRTHTKKFDRCVRKVKRRGKVSNAYAVCASHLPRGGRRRIKNLKPVAGAVICVAIGSQTYYYTRDNLLTTNRTSAKRFSNVRLAASVARHISRAVPTNARVSINKP